jgi:acetyl-CoA synthetase
LSSVKYPLQLQHVSKEHSEQYLESINNPERFWGDLARSRLKWIREFDSVMNCSFKEGKIRWFEGGVINISENVLDRHVGNHGDSTAIIWEKDEPGDNEFVTYNQLLDKTCQLANVLKTQGVRKGDRVVIYMPTSPLAVAAMLACARIGAVHSVVFAGFSAEALRDRIADSKAEVIITADQSVRGGRVHQLKEIVDSAIEPLNSVRKVLVMRRTGAIVHMGPKDLPLEEAMSAESTHCPVEPLQSEDPLFILYTSGSTGKPKGLVHTQAGYLLYAGLTHQLVFDYKIGDRYCCVADIGWITGHSYVVYGPLSNTATTVLFETSPEYPDPGRYWEMVQRLKLNQLYTSPTAVRSLHKHSDDYVKQYDRSSLRLFGCVGEPLNAEAWEWLYHVAGDGQCPIADTWWQTETGGIMITPLPSSGEIPLKPGFPQQPFFGVDPVITEEKDEGKELVGNLVSGRLCIRKPTPGMARTIHGDHQRFLDTYYNPNPGLYFSGDGARRDEEGHYQITGRVDDVINIKGHRIGTAEIESALVSLPCSCGRGL